MATGLAPQTLDTLEDTDPALFAALLAESGERWTMDTELAAATLEAVGQLIRVNLKAAGAKDSDLPKPIQVPRPGSPAPSSRPAAKPATGRNLAAWMRGRRHAR